MILAAVFLLVLLWYSYILLRSEREEDRINLYSLVPADAIAIWTTDDIHQFFKETNSPSFHHKFDSLNMADLLTNLRDNQTYLLGEKAHSTNKRMDKMLMSFHSPNTAKDQVLYCRLETNERSFVEDYIDKQTIESYSPRVLEYRKQDIYIYPLKTNDFLACYYHRDFIIVSYQEKLVEQAIDAYMNNMSVLNDSTFISAYNQERPLSGSKIYLRAREFPFTAGKALRDNHWIRFELKMNRDAIYLSGESFDNDESPSFTKALKMQEPVKVFPANMLPSSTFFISQFAVSEMDQILGHINKRNYPITNSLTNVEKADSCMYEYLEDNIDSLIVNLTFSDSINLDKPHYITNIQMRDRDLAELRLRTVRVNWAKYTRNNKYIRPQYFFFRGNAYMIYQLPEFKLTEKMSGNGNVAEREYFGCFYKDYLLVSTNDADIKAYIKMIDKGLTKEHDNVYKECMAGLAPESNCIIFADLNDIARSPYQYEHLTTGLLRENRSFFKDFIMIVQFTHTNGHLSPNITFIYEGDTD